MEDVRADVKMCRKTVCEGVRISKPSSLLYILVHYCSSPKKNISEIGILVLSRYQTGTAVVHWLKCCTTNWEVAGSIPADVIGIFH